MDLTKGDWIRIGREWRLLDGTRPEPRIEGRAEPYGCETGCYGWVLYHVKADGTRDNIGDRFYFMEGEAITDAEEKADELGGIPIVIDKETNW